MRNNKNLKASQENKDDEFYTRYEDVDAELRHYWQHFAGKSIHCPCDGYDSAFYEYFYRNYHAMSLTGLTATQYNPDGRGSLHGTDGFDAWSHPLDDDGSFSGYSAQKIMDKCDVVVTNPPFSLMSQFLDQVLGMGKDMLIVAPLNAFMYAPARIPVTNGKLKTGTDRVPVFTRPDGTEQPLGNTIWMTTLDSGIVKPPLKLTATYSPETHPTYDNYDAIECATCADIPGDYYGKMGVPTIFLERINYDQFEIVGNMRSLSNDFTINGKGVFHRIVIKRKGVSK